jgi:hypothetical protein
MGISVLSFALLMYVMIMAVGSATIVVQPSWSGTVGSCIYLFKGRVPTPTCLGLKGLIIGWLAHVCHDMCLYGYMDAVVTVMNSNCIHMRTEDLNIYMYKRGRIYKEPPGEI